MVRFGLAMFISLLLCSHTQIACLWDTSMQCCGVAVRAAVLLTYDPLTAELTTSTGKPHGCCTLSLALVDHIIHLHRASYLIQKGGWLPQLPICLCLQSGKACSLALCIVQLLGELAHLMLQLTARLPGLGYFSLHAKAARSLLSIVLPLTSSLADMMDRQA